MKLDEAHGTVEDDLEEKLQYGFQNFLFLSMERAADMPHSCVVNIAVNTSHILGATTGFRVRVWTIFAS